jgi:hypothetical protein
MFINELNRKNEEVKMRSDLIQGGKKYAMRM